MPRVDFEASHFKVRWGHCGIGDATQWGTAFTILRSNFRIHKKIPSLVQARTTLFPWAFSSTV
jgi:hypothetical protein